MITLEPPLGRANIADAWRSLGLSAAGLSRFLGTARQRVGLRGEVDVLLAHDATLRRLNRQFRGKNKPTDVLSFPTPEDLHPLQAGDLAISFETAQRQADEHGHTLAQELRILILHGLLHLNGMDHEADQGEMAALESQLRRHFRLPTGLIARAAQTSQSARAAQSAKTAKTAKAAQSARAAKTAQSAKTAKTAQSARTAGVAA